MEKNQKLPGISARELLLETFDVLKKKLRGEEVVLFSRALAEIADDSDYHRNRVGYTGYESAMLVKIGGKEWAIAFGTKFGSYPAEPYNCDIVAVRITTVGKSKSEVVVDVHDALSKNTYFRNSLIFALADGQLQLRENSLFGEKVMRLLKPKILDFVEQKLKTDPCYITMDLRPVVTSSVRYKKEFVVFLSETLYKALEGIE